MKKKLKAPFPYHGGKSRAAALIWDRFGEINTYVEPFCGSLAVLLANPSGSIPWEIVNDIDGLLINFWRAVKNEPETVAEIAEAPSTEVDLRARHNWVYREKDWILEALKEIPSFYSARAAAYWVYVQASAVNTRGLFQEKLGDRVPQLSSPNGIHSKSRRGNLVQIFNELSDRLRGSRICCGDWSRVVTNASIVYNTTPTGIFLDPPYVSKSYDGGVYEHSDSVFNDVLAWAIDKGDDDRFRIALCGYEGADIPDSWETVSWKRATGQTNNTTKERVWFSPHCLGV